MNRETSYFLPLAFPLRNRVQDSTTSADCLGAGDLRVHAALPQGPRETSLPVLP